MRPTDDQLRRFLAGTLPADEADQVASWVESAPDAADALARLERPDTLAAALAHTPGERSTRPQRPKDLSTANLTGYDTDDPSPDGPPAGTRTADGPPDPPTRAGATATGHPAGAADPPSPDLPAGYQHIGELGRGGMGVVYRARDLELDREVAVKVLGPNVRKGSSAGVRFRDEARITGQLQHPGIPPVYRLGELPDGRPFLALKLIKGRTLADLLAADPAGVNRLGVFEGICQAVGYAHAHGVIHRDLKPGNVMVGTFGEVQVMDWGLAKVLGVRERPAAADPDATRDPDPTHIRSARESDTEHGSVLGTPAFMAPEQAIGAVDQLDVRTDVFGLGGILCVLLTGRPPYVAADGEATRQLAARAKLGDCFARLDASGGEPGLVALCKRCLSAEPGDRPADGRAVAAAVGELRAAADERARTAETAAAEAAVREAEGRKRRRVLRWATLAVAAVLVAGTAVSVAFGVEANKQADQVGKKNTEVEQKAEEIARKSGEIASLNTDLTAANVKVKSQLEESQRSLALSILGPMAVGENTILFSEYERNAVWSLATYRDGPVGLLCLTEATNSTLTAQQLTGRPDLLYHAAVGLNSRRRAEVDVLFATRLKDANLSAETKLEVAVAAAGRCAPEASRIADLLQAALLVEKQRPWQVAKALAAVAHHLPADRAAAVRLAAANALLTTPVGDVDQRVVVDRQAELAVVCGKLPVDEAASLLFAQLGKSTSQSIHPMMADLLAGIAPDLSPQVCETAATNLLAQMGNRDLFSRTPLIDALALVCRKLPAKRAGEVLQSLLSTKEEQLRRDKAHLGREIAKAAAVWPADQAAEVCEKATDVLKLSLRGAYDHQDYYDLGVALLMLAERLPADKAADARKAGIAVFEKPRLAPRAGHEWATLTMRLVEACRHLSAEQAVALCQTVADAVQVVLRSTNDPADRAWLGGALSDATCGLPPDKAVPLVEKATAAMLASINSDKLDAQTKGQATMLLVEAVGRLPTDKAAEVCRKATDALRPILTSDKLHPFERSNLVIRVAGLCRWLPPERTVEFLLPLMTNTDQGWERAGVAQALASAARRLPSDKATEVCMTAAEGLFRDSTNLHALDTQRQQTAALTALALQFGRVDGDQRRLVPAVAGGITCATDLPTPRPLPPQKLVDLLKHPFCVKDLQRAVLDALEVTYDRRFADLWAFVAFAEKEHPELDLLTPPKRTETK